MFATQNCTLPLSKMMILIQKFPAAAARVKNKRRFTLDIPAREGRFCGCSPVIAFRSRESLCDADTGEMDRIAWPSWHTHSCNTRQNRFTTQFPQHSARSSRTSSTCMSTHTKVVCTKRWSKKRVATNENCVNQVSDFCNNLDKIILMLTSTVKIVL